jgi:hypothetical protein
MPDDEPTYFGCRLAEHLLVEVVRARGKRWFWHASWNGGRVGRGDNDGDGFDTPDAAKADALNAVHRRLFVALADLQAVGPESWRLMP